MRAVGSSLPRIDAADKVTGVAAYPGDINLPGQAWMTTLFAGVPHARVRALHVDAARSAPGVIAVLTGLDVPVNSFGLNVLDQPVLCGPDDAPGSTLTNTVRWEGDRIALVIAESQAQAEAAAKLVRADFEELPLVLDPEAARLPDAIQVHDYAGHAFAGKVPESNILLEYHLRHGDMAAGFAQADVIIEATYRTHAQEHAYLQPEAGVAFVREDGRIEVIVGGQWMHEDREQIAHALGLPDEEIVVRYPAIGGAFGGREDMSVQILLALATQKTGRPVKTIWSREESIRGHHKRHPYILKAKWGATKDGKLVAAQMDVTADAGSYASTSTKVLGNATLACLGPYEIPNVHVDTRAVYTHNCPNGAFRGFGGPQGHFAAEMQMNKLAHALGMDPVDFRLRNTLSDGAIIATGSPMPAGVTITPVIEAAATEAGWVKNANGWHAPKISQSPNRPISQKTSLDASKTHTLRGIGLAACFKNVGFSLGYPENAAACVELHGAAQIERAIVGAVGADVGQGAHSAFRQLAAQVLGIPVDRVEMAVDNTDITGSSGSASASRLTFMQGNAIVGAAQRALQAWQNEERPARADHVHYARKTTGYDPITGAGDPNITYGYCAQTADVEIDVETGHVTVKRLVSANDVGMAINPKLVEGQIEGAVAQSVGWTLLENVVQRNGHILNPNFSSYLIPGVLDVVEEIVPVILEFPDPQGPLGARGMAEMPFIPTAPAIAAAIHNATGVWMDELPFTPERVWRALQSVDRP